MKRLKLREVKSEDSLLLDFKATYTPQAPLNRELEPFLGALERFAGSWMPDVVTGKRERRYSRDGFWKSLEERRDDKSMALGLYRTEMPALDFALHLGLPPPTAHLGIWLELLPLAFFTDEQRCSEFVELVRAWAVHYPVLHAAAHSAADRQLADSPNFGRDDETTFRDGFDRVYQVFWLNVFGPALVATVGRERMLSTPAHRVEALPNGSVLLVTWPTAAGFASDEARQAQARALTHLRPDLDFDTVLRTLRQSSATLSPVEQRFPPDVAPLLSRVVDSVPISQRQRQVAEFNAYRPPVPDEWLPVESALPVDVPDVPRAVHALAAQAEHLVALLHSQVPSVFEATAESLADVDFHLWHENFPETFEREKLDAHAVPAMGAYLGQVLVRQLGGQWLPRKAWQETQVKVGARVWLPFVRAHRAMRSRQALLDYSLTQLFREAERHRG